MLPVTKFAVAAFKLIILPVVTFKVPKAVSLVTFNVVILAVATFNVPLTV